MRIWPWVMLASVGAIAAIAGGSRLVADDTEVVPSAKSPAVKPIAVGEATDPNVQPLLVDMEAYFRGMGVDTAIVTPFDVTVMPGAPVKDGPDDDRDATKPVAIPERWSWVRMGTLLRDHVIPVIRDLPFPVRVTGYRPADYNAAVGGAQNSRHIHNDAVDIWLKSANRNPRDADILRLTAAKHVVANPSAPLGFGAYQTDVHLDIGGRRTWKRGQEYIDKARAA